MPKVKINDRAEVVTDEGCFVGVGFVTFVGKDRTEVVFDNGSAGMFPARFVKLLETKKIEY